MVTINDDNDSTIANPKFGLKMMRSHTYVIPHSSVLISKIVKKISDSTKKGVST